MSEALKYKSGPDLNLVVERVSEIVAKATGNKFGEGQFHMVSSRMAKRLLELRISTGKEYLAYLEANFNREKEELIGLLTTHHTFFFREFLQFEFLRAQLPNIVAIVKQRGDKKIKIWSAACSRGQEVYSLAMFMAHYLPKIDPTIDFEVWGTDIDPQSVKIAENGVYHGSELKSVSSIFLDQNWVQGKDDIKDYFKARKSLVQKVHFSVANLLELPKAKPQDKFDIVFCRNVLIYFEFEDIKKVATQLMQALTPQGLFFTGVSEPLGNYGLAITGVGPSCYQAKNADVLNLKADQYKSASIVSPSSVPLASTQPLLASLEQRQLNILCVDDSPSILALLKKIFDGDKDFKVVATAENGLKAAEVLADKNLKVDLMTLDIHMPELDGIGYLKKFFNSSHPPVVMISSASRDDASTALQSFKLGATDFVEKPSLSNLMERGDEIKAKLKMAWMAKQEGLKPTTTSFDSSGAHTKKILNPEQKMIMLVASAGRKKDIIKLVKELPSARPPVLIMFEGHANILPALVDEWKSELGGKVEMALNAQHFFQQNGVYFADLKTMIDGARSQFQGRDCVLGMLGGLSPKGIQLISLWKGLTILVEESTHMTAPMKQLATDIFPVTSFPIGIINALCAKEDK